MARNPESNFWTLVRPLLAGLHPIRVENGCASGTPDVNCTLGWIELKQVRAENLPKRKGTILALDHFTPEQRAWLISRGRAGGSCWVLLRAGREWMLYRGTVAANILGRCTLESARTWSFAHWPAKPTRDQLQQALRESA